MKFGRWIRVGSLILLMCAHQGDSTLILGSMLMAATAAMTGGLIMGPLTIGGLIMMMMMAANNQNAQQRQTQTASSTSNIASTLENSQNLLNLLATLTGAAGNLAGSASTQQATLISPTNSPKALKRALYSPQNLDELLAASSRNTAMRRQWKSLSPPTTTTTRAPEPRMNTDFWNSKPATYFSPDTGFAVEPIPEDLLDIAMRLPQARNANMFGDLYDDGTVSTGGSASGSSNGADSTGSDFTSTMYPPRPITSSEQQLRWVASEPGDLFSSFPEVKEDDILNFVRKRSTREALATKFRLEDIANVTYANDKDPVIKEQMDAREKQEVINTRIFRQLSALDPFRCLPQLACNMQAAPPSRQTGILNDYTYLLKTVFERDDEDDEEEDKKPASSSVTKQANNKGAGVGNLASELYAAIASQSKRKKKLDYKSPTKETSGKSDDKRKKSDSDENHQNHTNDDDDDDDNDGISSEEIPMDEEELDRLLIKEQYEMEQLANAELLDDDPNMLPFILKSASQGPSYLGSDKRIPNPINYKQAAIDAGLSPKEAIQMDLDGPSSPSSLEGGVSDITNGFNQRPSIRRQGIGGRIPGGPAPTYSQPSPLFSKAKLASFRTEDLEGMSSNELTNLLKQVSGGDEIVFDEGTFDDHKPSVTDILSSFFPKLPEVAVGFTRRRTHTGNAAFDDDPFFDDFEMRRRNMNFKAAVATAGQQQQYNQASAQPKLRKVRRVVRRVKESGPAARVVFLKRMKRMLDLEQDPAVVFKMAKEVGAKIKSSRQCRFLFSSCPLNSTQLLGMIGNIRKAVVGLSNAQQLLSGNVNIASLSKQSQEKGQVETDFATNKATIGPGIVTLAAATTPAPTTTTNAPPMSVHQLTPMAPVQMVQPMFGMPQSPPHSYPHYPQSSHSQNSHSQNTIVVPQIVQVPVPMQQQAAPQQPIIIQAPPQQQAPFQHVSPQQISPQQISPQQISPQQASPQQAPPRQHQSSTHNHPVFNVVTDSAAKSQGSGLTSISHELPSGEKVEISMKLTGQQGQQQKPGVISVPVSSSKNRKKPAVPMSPASATTQKPAAQQPQRVLRPSIVTPQPTKNRNPAVDLVDLFDDDNSDNFLLPTKMLIDTEIKAPTTLDSLQAAILAIEKINQAATEKKKTTPTLLEDDENDQYNSNFGISKKPKVPSGPKIVPAGLRLPNKKGDENDDEGEDDETSEEEDYEDEGDDFHRYRGRIPDPLDPKRRNFVPVPTKEVPFQEATQLTVPATQTFTKKRLQVEESGGASSSEEDEHQRRRMITLTKRKIPRKPKILYAPHENMETPVFIPL